jgi:hypothetical protein
MLIELPEFPTNGCTYAIYDPHTLEPQNDSVYIRLLELGWAPEEFKGKSVLDIGANSGALSIHAHRRQGIPKSLFSGENKTVVYRIIAGFME